MTSQSSAPDDWRETVHSGRINYETDVVKHYVRLNGWLPSCRRRKTKVKRRPFRYFTFCAASAVDVFMLERDGILKRTQEGLLEATYFCEQDAEQFEEIVNLIGTRGQGLLGKFEEIVLFKETSETNGRTYLDPGPDKITDILRRQLQIKDKHQQLVAAFPFDVINLDATGTLFPPRQGPVSDLIDSIFTILKWQTETLLPSGNVVNEFTLLLTVQVDESAGNVSAIDQLCELVQHNLDQRPEFLSRWIEEFAEVPPGSLAQQDFVRFFTIALPKLLIEHGLSLAWDVTSDGRLLYQRARGQNTYTMMCEVLTFTRLSSSPKTELFNLQQGLPSQFTFQRANSRVLDGAWKTITRVDDEIVTGDTRVKVMAHLEKVLAFRQQVIDRLRSPQR